jgi:Domain of unknown function (DUF4276)
MTIHVLVEGPSERAFLEPWSARLLRGHSVRVHPHQGKGTLPSNPSVRPDPRLRGLLDQLPAKLRGFAASLDPENDGVVVLVDADDDDATELVASITKTARECAAAMNVTVHLAVEETEAFYLGDLRALEKVFPDADMRAARAYKPDSICNTWELFGRIVRDGGGNKVAWAEAMGKVVTISASESRSPSFKSLILGLRALVPSPTAPRKQRAYRHPPKDRRDPGKRR